MYIITIREILAVPSTPFSKSVGQASSTHCLLLKAKSHAIKQCSFPFYFFIQTPCSLLFSSCTAQLSACLRRELLHPSEHFCGPAVDVFQESHE